jgi:hypothetical protein
VTATLFILDTPENRPVAAVAGAHPQVTVDRTGPYFRIRAEQLIEVDRRATGCRHAVWYSSVAGVLGGRIIQWDKNALRVAAE